MKQAQFRTGLLVPPVCEVCTGRLTLAEMAFCVRRGGNFTYPVEQLDDPGHERPIRAICRRCYRWAVDYRIRREEGEMLPAESGSKGGMAVALAPPGRESARQRGPRRQPALPPERRLYRRSLTLPPSRPAPRAQVRSITLPPSRQQSRPQVSGRVTAPPNEIPIQAVAGLYWTIVFLFFAGVIAVRIFISADPAMALEWLVNNSILFFPMMIAAIMVHCVFIPYPGKAPGQPTTDALAGEWRGTLTDVNGAPCAIRLRLDLTGRPGAEGSGSAAWPELASFRVELAPVVGGSVTLRLISDRGSAYTLSTRLQPGTGRLSGRLSGVDATSGHLHRALVDLTRAEAAAPEGRSEVRAPVSRAAANPRPRVKSENSLTVR
jgi:hypothetical protein